MAINEMRGGGRGSIFKMPFPARKLKRRKIKEKEDNYNMQKMNGPCKMVQSLCVRFSSLFTFTPSHKEIIHKELPWSNVIVPTWLGM